MNIARFLVDLICKKRPDLKRDDVIDFVDTWCGSDRLYYVASNAVPLAEAAKLLNDPDFDYSDFVYSRGLDTVFFNVKAHTVHEIFMAYLYWIETELLTGKFKEGNAEDGDTLTLQSWENEWSETFLTECMGLFSSSAYGMQGFVKLSRNFKMNFQEQQAFRKFRTLRVDGEFA